MTVEKRDQRIVIYLTESEYQAVTWAAARARRRLSEAIRLVAIDWANSQVERANQERGQGCQLRVQIDPLVTGSS